jgi:hypothetical protein
MMPDNNIGARMTCSEFEVLLCDYLDGTLDPAQSQLLLAHQRDCVACAAFAHDVSGAVAFIGRTEDIAPPAELLTRITFDIPKGSGEGAGGIQKLFAKWLRPVLQPRFAMGMAMTILSFSMLGRFTTIDVRQLKPSDLDPVKLWAAADDRVYRSWQRAVKYYESLRLVYEVQSRLSEWTEQEDEDRRGQAVGAAARTAGSGKEAGKPQGGQGKK